MMKNELQIIGRSKSLYDVDLLHLTTRYMMLFAVLAF